MLPEVTNILRPGSAGAAGESVTRLLESDGFRLEHIASNGETSPEGFWYDQPEAEWVALLCGEATLEFQGGGILRLGAGDGLLIPARSRHRVGSCSRDAVWLALHFRAGKT